MKCEVAVVGAGIGGLTVAALLAKRGVDVCVFERESAVGGCAANFEKFGYTFEQSYGVHTGWGNGEIHQRIFAELGVAPPEVRLLDPTYVVRLDKGEDVVIGSTTEDFYDTLRAAFPECAEAATAFYEELAEVESKPAFASDTVDMHLVRVSPRFRRFIDLQLQQFGQVNSEQASYLFASSVLTAPQRGMFAILGGTAQLANKLAESFVGSGGRLRLNTPVLRLAYNSEGNAGGVDLLSGETVMATRAIVSNLTIWDTFGKLVGLNRTPSEIRKQLNTLKSCGAYLMFLGMDEAATQKLKADRLLLATPPSDALPSQLMFSVAAAWDARAPEKKRAVTVHAFANVDDWFTFHTDQTEEEEMDQRTLETWWSRLHQAMPELGSSVEVIETMTPRTYYEHTRRKLGMVSGIPATPNAWISGPETWQMLPNLHIISDTAVPGGLERLTSAAFSLADSLE